MFTRLAAPYSLGTVIDSSLIKAVYTPKSVFLHATSLLQPCGHWGIFVTAASRRSLGSVSVPVRRVMLSHPLSVIALVSHYLTNKLIRRELFYRQITLFHQKVYRTLALVSQCYFLPIGRFSRVTHPSATKVKTFVRLACVKHTASVHPEPGSNSQNVLQNFKRLMFFPYVRIVSITILGVNTFKLKI